MRKRNERLCERDRQIYLNGVRKYMIKGIPVFIDGEMIEEDELEQLFSPPEGMFYMADFVIEEMPEAGCAKEGQADLLRESADEGTPYLPSGARERFTLKEIRFDPAYHS